MVPQNETPNTRRRVAEQQMIGEAHQVGPAQIMSCWMKPGGIARHHDDQSLQFGEKPIGQQPAADFLIVIQDGADVPGKVPMNPKRHRAG